MPRFALLLALMSALSAQADRVRVVVAVESPDLVRATGEGRPVATRQDVIESAGSATRVERWGSGPAFEAEMERAEVETLRRDPRVRAVEIDEGGTAALYESVPLIGADVVQAQGWSGAGVTVAIVDSGIDRAHPAFAGRVTGEQCYCENLDGTGCCPNGAREQSGGGSAADDYGHGTHVAGIVAAGGGFSPHGVAPGANLVAVKVLNRDGDLRSFTQLFRALEWIDTNHPEARVVNVSIGSNALYATQSACDQSAVALGFEPLISAMRMRGVLVTASSGNQSSGTKAALPACISPVLGVGAVYDAPGSYKTYCEVPNAGADQVTCFSNSNATIDLLAPGATILSTWRGGGTKRLDGTSMAAPHVAGVIALMLQAARGAVSADQIEQILETTGKPVLDPRNALTIPRVDAAGAVAATPRPPAPARVRAVRH